MAIANDKPWKDAGLTKAEWVKREVAEAVNAGKAWDLEIVDFSDPNRPASCLEVDFPIIPINQIAKTESSSGAGRKPIYTMNKWWARRASSVFRALLISASLKAPEERSEASKLVWDVYYGNHQKKKTFANLKVADIFMGGGTTIVEGARLGMQMFGNDLNPVAWFVVKTEVDKVDRADVDGLLKFVESSVRPEILPFFACDCPRGHKGSWFRLNSDSTEEENLDELMPSSFDPLTISPEERKLYRYDGPEVIYTFWAKHGPCQVTACGHRTPIMPNPVIAVKEISIKYWDRKCGSCGEMYHIEEREARMAPGEPLIVADTEKPYAIAELQDGRDGTVPFGATCPHCRSMESFGLLGKAKKKKVSLSLLVHPDWLRGEASEDDSGQAYGGSADDDAEATVRWNQARARNCKLIEVRGTLPGEITLEDGTAIKTGKDGGTVPGKSKFACGECGTTADVRNSISSSGKNGPIAMYAHQGYCPTCSIEGQAYNGRFFIVADSSRRFDAALNEWHERKSSDLESFWPKSEIPYGFMTAMNNGDIRVGHGFTHWWKLFHARHLLGFSQLLRAITNAPNASVETKMFVLSSFQRFLQHNNLLCFWDIQQDCLAPSLSNSNFHPKNTIIENAIFTKLGRGNFCSSIDNLYETIDWHEEPWDLASNDFLTEKNPQLENHVKGKTSKVDASDRLAGSIAIENGSSTELNSLDASSFDLVITDPPFGGLLHYSELADFFYVWMRLALKTEFPAYFTGEYTPKTLEAVANRARQQGKDEETGKSNADMFYQRVLTDCWREGHRILKPGGMLAFTFHHSEDAPWVSVLESLFDAGFYLEATYPLRSDDTKGEGSKPGTFGSQKIEYDIIHVCRKRQHSPKPISWPKLRRQVLRDVRELKDLLEHHQEDGLPEADLQVIRRGKALEYFSRHYGTVYKDQDTPMTVLEALLGINQLLDEEAGGAKEPPPHMAEPFTRMLLRLFDGNGAMARDQMQKFLRGTGSAPSDYSDRGWIVERSKIFYLVPPPELAESWINRHRRGMTSDYDQAMFFIGACYEGSGINASDTLNNANFRPHVALGSLLTWFKTHGADTETRNAASMASRLYKTWESKNKKQSAQLSLFESLGEEEDD